MMPEISLTGVLVVAAVAFAVPLGLGLSSSVRLLAVVLDGPFWRCLGETRRRLPDLDAKKVRLCDAFSF